MRNWCEILGGGPGKRSAKILRTSEIAETI